MRSGPQRADEFKLRLRNLQNNPSFIRKSAINIRDGAGVFEKLLGDGRYKTVLEIGTFRGVTAAFMAQFVDRVITIDLKNGQLERQDPDFDRRQFWRSIGANNITLHRVYDDADKARIIAGLDFDFAFIDGDHTAPHPANDFALVQRCGAVLFHDHDGHNGVTEFVATLPRKQLTFMDIFAFWQAQRG